MLTDVLEDSTTITNKYRQKHSKNLAHSTTLTDNETTALCFDRGFAVSTTLYTVNIVAYRVVGVRTRILHSEIAASIPNTKKGVISFRLANLLSG